MIDNSDSETLAINALVWLSNDPDLMSRFLSLTGIEASDIRYAAREPGFLAGVLQFFLAHEPTLLRFCEETGTNPSSLQHAVALLPGGAASEF